MTSRSMNSCLSFTLVLIAICSPTSAVAQEQPETNQNNLVIAAGLVWETLDVIRQKHVNPPLRNQIILDGMGRLFPDQKRKLFRQIEKINSREQLKDLLIKAVQAEQDNGSRSSASPPDLTNPVAIANAFFRSVPGAPQVVTAYQSGINQQLSENRYVGIGIALSRNNELTSISVAFRGGPAQKAGIKNGDQILKVDGDSMVGKPLGEVVMALRGPMDSEVSVVVSQPGKNPRSYKMTRGVVPIASAKGVAEKGDTDWDYKIPDHPDVAYIEVTDITGSTAAELRTAFRQIERERFKSLVIDFRNCFRAEIHHMLMVADLLISSEKLGQWSDAQGKRTELKIRPISQLPDLPITLIASPAQANEVKLLIQSLMVNRDAQLVGRLNPAPARIRGTAKLPSGAGTVENLFIGEATLDAPAERVATLGQTGNQVAQVGRFRSGSKQIDEPIRQAAKLSQN